MSSQNVVPYGSWHSPLTADMVASGGVSLGGILVDGPNIYWLEGRPAEAGRTVVVRLGQDGTTQDLLPSPYNARSRVYEYGGAPYTVKDEVVVFVNFADNRVYRLVDGDPQAVTPKGEMRYADLSIDPVRGRILCVREDHSGPGEAINTVVSVPLSGGSEDTVLVSGNDFYASPRLSPDGRQLAWLTWCHPNMPWDGTELCVADISDDGAVNNARCVVGRPGESVLQPEWAPDGTLYFISDRTDWWNIYRLRDGTVEPVTDVEAEIGGPMWQFGQTWYTFVTPDTIACLIDRSSLIELAEVDLTERSLRTVPTPYSSWHGIAAHDGAVLAVAASPFEIDAVVRVEPSTGDVTKLRSSSTQSVDDLYISVPHEVSFPTTNGATSHGWFYSPHNPDFEAPDGELPPLIVLSHGGPTGERGSALNLGLQFWTSRGFAVLDVNYRGSSGFGRPYREALNGQWGVSDVDDCVDGAQYLVNTGQVDGARLIIRGGSAGGYTTLSALTFRDVFHAGASHYGIGDLEPFVKDTHKFESRYMDRLIGPYPEAQEVYHRRSPIHYADQIAVPMILLQGLDDKVVPPNQAEMMIEALRDKGLPFAYVPFEGEGHGFRKAENVKRALEAELYFYSRVFHFDLPGGGEAIPIENLDA